MDTRFVFLGQPGAGKGTQAVRISQKIGVPIVGTGSIFREAIAKDTAVGKQIAQFVNSGLLVPDKLTNAIVKQRLKDPDCQKGFILDGYPRNLAQAKSLDALLQRAHGPLDHVLYFKIEASLVIERMSQRRICSRCGQIYSLVSTPPAQAGQCDRCGGALVMRADDQPDSIRNRLKVYEEQTSPLRHYYESRGILSVVNASLSVQDVAKQVEAICLRK